MLSLKSAFHSGQANLLSIAFLISIFVISPISRAEEFLDPVVIIGSRHEQPLSEVLPSITVITKEEIQRSQARSVVELLMGEPGIEISTTGGLGATSSLFLRGQSSNSVAIYVDGIRIQPDGAGSMSNTSWPPVQSIQRVEILRGNSSALYGEAAIGGVINIMTTSASNAPPKSFGSVTYGSNKTVDTTLGTAGRVEDTKFNITANTTNSSGFAPIDHSVYPTSSTSLGDYKGHGISLGASQVVHRDLEIGFKERYQDNTYDFNATDPVSYAYLNSGIYMRTISNDTTLFAKIGLSENWFSQVDITNSKLDYQYTPITALAPDTTSATNTLNWNNTYELSKYHKTSFGLTYTNQHFDDGAGDLMYRESLGVFIGDSLKWGDFDFQLNIRRDGLKVSQPNAVSIGLSDTSGSNFGATTGLFGVGYHLTNALKLTAAASTGFRAPAVAELFPNPANYVCPTTSSCFNPNLTPEIHHTVESGIEYINANTNTRLVYFNTNTHNGITYVGGTSTQYAYVNMPYIVNHGWEFSERATWMGYRLIGAYTSQNPTNESPGATPLLRKAKEFGSVDLAKTIDLYDVGAKAIFSSSRYDNDTNFNLTTLNPYHIWSFYAGYKYTDEVTFRIRLDNAFNEKYQVAYGYNTPGRTAWLSMVYQQK